MIGIFLSSRRTEFYHFLQDWYLDFEELLDPATVNFSRYSSVYTDGSTFSVGPFEVKAFSSSPFSEIFASEAIKRAGSPLIPKEQLLLAFDRYFNQVVVPAHVLVSHLGTINIEDVSSTVAEHAEPLKVSLIKPPLLEIEEPAYSIPIQSNQITPFTVELVKQPEQIRIEAPEDYRDAYAAHNTCLDGDIMPVPVREAPPYGYQQPQPVYQPDPYVQRPQISTPIYQQHQIALPVYQPQAYPQQVQPNRQGNIAIRGQGGLAGKMHIRSHHTANKGCQMPIITFSSLTDKTGVSTVAFTLAKSFAIQNPQLRILYLDLDISNPNSIAMQLGLNPNTSATVLNVAQMGQADFVAGLSMLTETLSADDATISLITFGDCPFAAKMQLMRLDYTQMLRTLADSFDIVLVDLGKLQATLEYQTCILNSNIAKHILLADGSSNRAMQNFVNLAKGLPGRYEVVVNKYNAMVGTFAIEKQLLLSPLSLVNQHRNVELFMADKMILNGTSLYQDLVLLGGKL